MLSVVGLPQGAVREGRQRVQAALRNSGLPFPRNRITVSLAPADLKKEGSGFDLPMAIGLLAVTDGVPAGPLAELMILGELGLDGEIRPVRGVLPVALAAVRSGRRVLVVPRDNAAEAMAASAELEVIPAADLAQVVEWLNVGAPRGPAIEEHFGPAPSPPDAAAPNPGQVPDLRGIVGHPLGRRALEVAAAGSHNLLFTGPPGTGKTLLARALPGLLPPLEPAVSREATAVHSVAGLLPPGAGLLGQPPFRAPHHGISAVGLVGGGRPLRPGEASLAHGGVLFLDELPEFGRQALESLRQPMEDGEVLVVRARERACFPSRFTLVAAMNPCPCGRAGASSGPPCTCDPASVRRYRSRVSGPLLDRIDLQVQIDPVSAERILDPEECEGSAAVRERVLEARMRPVQDRGGRGGVGPNAAIPARMLPGAVSPTPRAIDFLRAAAERFRVSPRGLHRVLRVARTISDLEGRDRVVEEHVAEALQFRVDPSPVHSAVE